MMKSDAQLQRDVIDELRWDPAVGRAEIGVAAKDGVVTLTGQIDSLAKKYAAERAAERVAGVRAVAEELAVHLPMSSKRTDTEIAHAVADRLRWDIDVPEAQITARVENGWVTLDGETDWQFQKNAAERAVRYLIGVMGVSNRVSIKKYASAPDVQRRIESAFERHAALDSRQITVDAFDGRVTLRGTVRSWAERQNAEHAAWSAPGVISVHDELAVQI
jgi:osmotically-inducible protein OsmY